MRATRVDDSSSGDGLPSHRHIDTFGRRVVIPDTATGISEPAISQGRAHLYFVELHDIRQRVRARHASPRCGTLYDQRVLLRSSRSASESRLPRHLWHCSCLYAVLRARTKWLCAGAEVELSTEAIRKEVMKSLTSIRWHRILRAHHQWTAFQSIRYTLWLMR